MSRIASARAARRRLPAVALLAGLAVLVSAAPSGAVVGGSPAPPGRWPWMAAVLERDEADSAWAQYCGGVVIAPRRVLTAAHCAIGERSTAIDVLVGRTRLTVAGGRRVHVAAISVYPGYVTRREPSLDAAVLTLASDAGVPAVALARPGDDAAWSPGTQAWAMGWGRLNRRRSEGGQRYYADRLRELSVPIQGDDACERAFGLGFSDFPYRPEWLLCAGTAAGTAGVCFGDSGGPLVVGGPAGWLDVGVVAATDSCAARGYFDLYTRVDRISGFALARGLTAQPDPVRRPTVTGRLRAGRIVRCSPGRLARRSGAVQLPLEAVGRSPGHGARAPVEVPPDTPRRPARRPLRGHGRQSRRSRHRHGASQAGPPHLNSSANHGPMVHCANPAQCRHCP